MSKNVVVLAMSTLPGQSKNINEISENRFSWNQDDKTGYLYRGQMEPISTMIREREGSLDKVIILATKETREPQYVSDEEKISAVDYYLKRMDLSESQAEIVPVEENDFIPAISQTVDVIRNYWKDNVDEMNHAKLWIDTQGSFRNINLVLNAVITLLKPDNIEPSGIYSMNFNRDKEIQKIIDQTNTYKIFQFVSGINEFIRSGRAEQLIEYYHYIHQDVPKVVEVMKDIAEAIQMCDMRQFDQYLQQLRKVCREELDNTEELMSIFLEQIKVDYGKLLDEKCTGLDVVEWFYKKGFYQQAITYVEAKMPKEWAEKGIISYSITPPNALKNLNKKLSKTFENEENTVVNQIAYKCFGWKSICNKAGVAKDLKNLKKGRNEAYLSSGNRLFIEFTQKEHMTVDIHCKNSNRVMNMILLYKLLKAERNNFNHMSEEGVRASREQLGETISIFLATGRRVYEDIC